MKRLFISASLLVFIFWCSGVFLFSQGTGQEQSNKERYWNLYRAGIISYETYQHFLEFDAEFELVKRIDEGDEEAIQTMARIQAERERQAKRMAVLEAREYIDYMHRMEMAYPELVYEPSWTVGGKIPPGFLETHVPMQYRNYCAPAPYYWNYWNQARHLERMQTIGGPYYNPYSSSSTDFGYILRRNLADIAARKRR